MVQYFSFGVCLVFTERAFLSKNQYYFFSRLIDNRATEKGHWQEHDHVDQTIFSSSSGKKVGIKKYLLFIVDKAPNKIKTSWVMEEYHLSKNGLFGRNYKRGRNQAQVSKKLLFILFLPTKLLINL